MEAWLRADRRRQGALLRAQAALHAIETAVVRGPSVLASGNDADYGQARPSPPRRHRLAIGAIAACLLALIVVAPARFWPTTPDPIVTRDALNLSDGSIVTLGDGANVTVQMTDHARTVTLESSEAVFNVAKDAKRPFVVRSGEVFAQAVGTVYSVTRVGSRGALVNVSEGSVLVWADGEADRGIVLNAGDQLTLDPDASMPQARDPGQISLDNESILAASKRFNRVNRIQIVVEDPAVGDVRIVGLFKANDPEQFAQAAAVIAGAQVTHRDGRIVLQTRGSPVIKN
ncbi:FecR family protein [Luteimonas sp. A649]